MSTLKEHLARVEKRHGKDSFVAQQLRNQIMAEESGQGFQEIWIAGAVKFPDKKAPKKKAT